MRLKPLPTKIDALADVLRKMSLPRTAPDAYRVLKAAEHRLGFDPLKDRKRLHSAKVRANVESYRSRGGWAWRRSA